MIVNEIREHVESKKIRKPRNEFKKTSAVKRQAQWSIK